MYLCYMDESGTPDVPGNTSHYVLAGVSIPVQCWKSCDTDIQKVKSKYRLTEKEIHVAWLLRSYPEQNRISGFEALNHSQRIQQVNSFRNAELLRLQRTNIALYRQTRKTYKKTEIYIHLAQKERQDFIKELARVVASWNFVRLFAECVDKLFYDPVRYKKSIEEESFEQVVSRFQQCLRVPKIFSRKDNLGLLIHDNNETVAKKHTILMKKFHRTGTLWTKLDNIIETPLFVDSELTGMVQIADLCAYSLRRYLENHEEELFDLIFKRADRNKNNVVVGIRHFTNTSCACKICSAHRK